MEATKIGVKSTDNLFVFPMIGFDTYLVYERDKNRVSACDNVTGKVVNEKELHWIYRNMTFEDFITYARNCYLYNINFN